MERYDYLIVGAGLAGISAAEGIRQIDPAGSILLLGDELSPPYQRPPLSKQLWFGKTTLDEILIQPEQFFESNRVELIRGVAATRLIPQLNKIVMQDGGEYRFGKLLLATGSAPRRLPIPGGDLEGINYFRTLNDYLALKQSAGPGKSVLVIGGGFIGSELAAALSQTFKVSLLFPAAYLCDRVFPESLARAIENEYRKRGIEIIDSDSAVSIEKRGERFLTRTRRGLAIETDSLVAGIGAVPRCELAIEAGLEVGDGILVNEYLETSHPGIYAAGDNSRFPYSALGCSMRIEHWDHALNQGRAAGRNMAQASEAYHYQPFFFSDLFEYGYEATGLIDSRLEMFADWTTENETGVIYYLQDDKVRGVLLFNTWGKLDAARELIRQGKRFSPGSLRGFIR